MLKKTIDKCLLGIKTKILSSKRYPLLCFYSQRGITLIELIAAVAVVGVLASVTFTSYQEYVDHSENQIAIRDLQVIALQIDAFAGNNNGSYPADLSALGLDNYEDPWGNTYRYLNVEGVPRGQVRKDRNLNPVNSDYDLYSMGPDGRTQTQFQARFARDDIVRANSGRFFGIAEEY
jgi:general secretion pathway protein G